jgi:maleylacetate reductase
MSSQGVSKALVVGSGTPRSIKELEAIREILGKQCVGICAEATHQVYPEKVELVVQRARALSADCVVTVGGGGPIGYGKMTVHQTEMPLFCLVTTYSGSELTSAQGSISNGEKTMTVDENMRPKVRFYDTDLMISLPVPLSIISGMNAMAHAVEALYSPHADRFSIMIAEEAIRVMCQGLTALKDCETENVAQSENEAMKAARLDCAYAAFLCIAAFGALGIEHKLAHVLGGSFGMPHAASHCIVLPHAIAYNNTHAPKACARICAALGVDPVSDFASSSGGGAAAAALYSLQKRLGAPTSLREIGFPEAELPRLAELVTRNTERYSTNPAPFDEQKVLQLVGDAWRGDPPGKSLLQRTARQQQNSRL